MKGISPLVAATLLIVMVVAIGTIVMGWLYTFTKSAQESVSNRTEEAVSCSGGNIDIQDVYLSPGTSGTARAIIKNTGFVDDMIITAAQIYNNTGHNFTGSGLPISDFDKGEIVTVLFANISIPLCANFSQIVVGTNCGSISDTYTKTPQGC